MHSNYNNEFAPTMLPDVAMYYKPMLFFKLSHNASTLAACSSLSGQ